MPTAWGTKIDPWTIRVYEKHAKALEKFSRGDRLRISIDKDRHGKFNSLVHVMFGLLAEAINRGPATTSIDGLKNWVKIKKGWYDVVPLPTPTIDGQTHAIEYKSVAFNKMGEEEFHRFAVDACEMIRAELAPWLSGSPEWSEVMEIIAKIEPEVAA